MGTEIAILIVIPGLTAFGWLIYKIVFGSRTDAVICLLILLSGLGMGGRGMLNAYRPDFPENWNTSFLLGWFLMSSSFWLTVFSAAGALGLLLTRKMWSGKERPTKDGGET